MFSLATAAILHCYSDGQGMHRDLFRSKYLNVLDFILGNTGALRWELPLSALHLVLHAARLYSRRVCPSLCLRLESNFLWPAAHMCPDYQQESLTWCLTMSHVRLEHRLCCRHACIMNKSAWAAFACMTMWE